MIYSFPIWRQEISAWRMEIVTTLREMKSLNVIDGRSRDLILGAEVSELRFYTNQRLLKAIFLSCFAMRKMDDAAKKPLPPGLKRGVEHDRQLVKRLSDYPFNLYVGRESVDEHSGVKTISSFNVEERSGRYVTNLAMHSEELRLFDPPFDSYDGFWIRSDQKPDLADPTCFSFVNMEQFDCMLQDFSTPPEA